MPSESLQEELAALRADLRRVLAEDATIAEATLADVRSLITTLDARAARCSNEIARELVRVGNALLARVVRGSEPGTARGR